MINPILTTRSDFFYLSCRDFFLSLSSIKQNQANKGSVMAELIFTVIEKSILLIGISMIAFGVIQYGRRSQDWRGSLPCFING